MSRDFLTETRSKKVIDTFTINGEEFDIFEPSGSATLISLALAASYREASSIHAQARAFAGCLDMLGSCLDPQAYERVKEFCVLPEYGLSIEQVTQLVLFVVEVATKPRPTEASGGSATSPRRTGRKSTASARSTA